MLVLTIEPQATTRKALCALGIAKMKGQPTKTRAIRGVRLVKTRFHHLDEPPNYDLLFVGIQKATAVPEN